MIPSPKYTPRISSSIRSLGLLRSILNLHGIQLSLSETRLFNVMTETLLILAQSGNDLPVSTPDRLDLEQTVHALERNTLGLGDEEEDEEDGADHQRREEEVHAITHGGEHLRVKREMRKFHSQLEAAAQAWARERMFVSNISCVGSQYWGFHRSACLFACVNLPS